MSNLDRTEGKAQMKLLILHEPALTDITPDRLGAVTEMPIQIGSYPVDGIAVISSDKEVDWSWPDSVIVIGTVNIGRNKADVTLPATVDYLGQIAEYIVSMDETSVEGEGTDVITG